MERQGKGVTACEAHMARGSQAGTGPVNKSRINPS